MTAEINKAVERLTMDAERADPEAIGWLFANSLPGDLQALLSELSRLREENTTLTRSLPIADGYARPTLDFTIHHGFREQADKAKEDKAFIDATLSRQSKEGGE